MAERTKDAAAAGETLPIDSAPLLVRNVRLGIGVRAFKAQVPFARIKRLVSQDSYAQL